MTSVFIVFFGSGIGGALRHGVNFAALKWFGSASALGTLAINIAGSGLMGLIIGWLTFRTGEGWTQPARLFLTTGVLGGFTTFSAFSLEAVLLWQRGEPGWACAYVLGSVVLSLAALTGGLAFVRGLS